MILAIDPGNDSSGYVAYTVKCNKIQILEFDPKANNFELLDRIGSDSSLETVVIERLKPRGQQIGESTFKSIEWASRLLQRAIDADITTRWHYVANIRQHLCGRPNATDANVNAALNQRFSKDELKGLTSHSKAALALAVYDFEVINE